MQQWLDHGFANLKNCVRITWCTHFSSYKEWANSVTNSCFCQLCKKYDLRVRNIQKQFWEVRWGRNKYVSQKNRWILFGCQLSTLVKYFCWRVQHNPSPSRHSEFISERHSMIVALWLSNCINTFYVNGGVVARNKITLLNKFVLDLSWCKSGELTV